MQHHWIEVLNRRWCLTCNAFQQRGTFGWRPRTALACPHLYPTPEERELAERASRPAKPVTRCGDCAAFHENTCPERGITRLPDDPACAAAVPKVPEVGLVGPSTPGAAHRRL